MGVFYLKNIYIISQVKNYKKNINYLFFILKICYHIIVYK